MGTSSVTRAAIKEAMSRHRATDSATNTGKWWSDEVLRCLQDADPPHSHARLYSGSHSAWHQVGIRQLSGMLLMVLARRELVRDVSCVASSSVPCGVGGFGGNKGAVAIRVHVFRQPIVFINSHFAAHQVR
jgi:phosphatidylinositol-bisphosphatase